MINKWIFLIVICAMPVYSIAQKHQDKTIGFEYGLNIYAEGRTLFFAPRTISSLPITYTGDQAFSIGVEGKCFFTKKWSIYTAVNYLYQQADWQGRDLRNNGTFDPILGFTTTRTSFDIRQSWHQLQLPLLIGFNTDIGKDQITFLAGFSTELIIALKSTGTVIEAGNTWVHDSRQFNKQNIPLHWVIGISYQKKITSKLVLGIRPSFGLLMKKRSILNQPYTPTFGSPIRSPKLGLALFFRFMR